MMFLFRCCMKSGCSRRREAEQDAVRVLPAAGENDDIQLHSRLLPSVAEDGKRFADYSGCSQYAVAARPFVEGLNGNDSHHESVLNTSLHVAEEIYRSGESGFGETSSLHLDQSVDGALTAAHNNVSVCSHAGDAIEVEQSNLIRSIAQSKDSLVVSSGMCSILDEQKLSGEESDSNNEEGSERSLEVKYVADKMYFQSSLFPTTCCIYHKDASLDTSGHVYNPPRTDCENEREGGEYDDVSARCQILESLPKTTIVNSCSADDIHVPFAAFAAMPHTSFTQECYRLDSIRSALSISVHTHDSVTSHSIEQTKTCTSYGSSAFAENDGIPCQQHTTGNEKVGDDEISSADTVSISDDGQLYFVYSFTEGLPVRKSNAYEFSSPVSVTPTTTVAVSAMSAGVQDHDILMKPSLVDSQMSSMEVVHSGSVGNLFDFQRMPSCLEEVDEVIQGYMTFSDDNNSTRGELLSNGDIPMGIDCQSGIITLETDELDAVLFAPNYGTPEVTVDRFNCGNEIVSQSYSGFIEGEDNFENEHLNMELPSFPCASDGNKVKFANVCLSFVVSSSVIDCSRSNCFANVMRERDHIDSRSNKELQPNFLAGNESEISDEIFNLRQCYASGVAHSNLCADEESLISVDGCPREQIARYIEGIIRNAVSTLNSTQIVVNNISEEDCCIREMYKDRAIEEPSSEQEFTFSCVSVDDINCARELCEVIAEKHMDTGDSEMSVVEPVFYGSFQIDSTIQINAREPGYHNVMNAPLHSSVTDEENSEHDLLACSQFDVAETCINDQDEPSSEDSMEFQASDSLVKPVLNLPDISMYLISSRSTSSSKDSSFSPLDSVNNSKPLWSNADWLGENDVSHNDPYNECGFKDHRCECNKMCAEYVDAFSIEGAITYQGGCLVGSSEHLAVQSNEKYDDNQGRSIHESNVFLSSPVDEHVQSSTELLVDIRTSSLFPVKHGHLLTPQESITILTNCEEEVEESFSSSPNISSIEQKPGVRPYHLLTGERQLPTASSSPSRKFSPTGELVNTFFEQYVFPVNKPVLDPIFVGSPSLNASSCTDEVDSALDQLEFELSILNNDDDSNMVSMDELSHTVEVLTAEAKEVHESKTSDCYNESFNSTTPRRKKSVRFADAIGQDLESVRHIEATSAAEAALLANIANIIPGMLVATDRRARWSERHPRQNVSATAWRCETPAHLRALFSSPGTQSDFLDRVRRNRVVLESCTFDDSVFAISGLVRVANIAYHKNVSIRYSLDSWETHADVDADYVPRSNDGTTDRFAFTIILPPRRIFGIGSCMAFAVCFCAGDGDYVETYWDNNCELNYVIECCGNKDLTSTQDVEAP